MSYTALALMGLGFSLEFEEQISGQQDIAKAMLNGKRVRMTKVPVKLIYMHMYDRRCSLEFE